MPRVAIRRLQLRGLAPRDHPSPADLQIRLTDAARAHLPGALAEAVAPRPEGTVLRIRRLDVDISLGAEVEPKAFAGALARAIAAIRHAGDTATESGDGVIGFPSRAHHLVALLDALAEGQAAHRWWLRDAAGLALLSRPAALRTAILSDAVIGARALRLFSPGRRAQLVRLLGAVETDRVLDGLAAAVESAASASFDACATAVAALGMPPPLTPLDLYLAAAAQYPNLAGPRLLDTVRALLRLLEAAAAAPLSDAPVAADELLSSREQVLQATASGLPATARRILVREAMRRASDPASRPRASSVFTPFGGLLILLHSLDYRDILRAVPEDATAALIAYAALGLCAGRSRFAAYLGDPLWRELFGLDVQDSGQAMRDRLAAIPAETWHALAPLGQPLDRQRDARFLLAATGSKPGRRVLATLARAIIARFARRLWGFREASAGFLWVKLLDISAALERCPGGWSARLARPPLDIVLSLGGIAEGTVTAPAGARVQFTRVSA